MGVDRCIAAVDEEAELAKTAAVSYEFIDVGMSYRRAGALECKIGKMTAKRILNPVGKSLNSLRTA